MRPRTTSGGNPGSVSVLFLLLFVLVPAGAAAQEKVTFGMGISFNPAAIAGDTSAHFQPAGLADIQFFMQVGPHFRADLISGLYHHTSDQTLMDAAGPYTMHLTGTVFRVGMGVYYTWEPDTAFTLYAGPRVGILYSSLEADYAGSVNAPGNQTIWGAFFWGLSFGAEYALSAHFSLGGEFRTTSTGFGVPNELYPSSTYPRDYKQNVFSTDALILARLYF